MLFIFVPQELFCHVRLYYVFRGLFLLAGVISELKYDGFMWASSWEDIYSRKGLSASFSQWLIVWKI